MQGKTFDCNHMGTNLKDGKPQLYIAAFMTQDEEWNPDEGVLPSTGRFLDIATEKYKESS